MTPEASRQEGTRGLRKIRRKKNCYCICLVSWGKAVPSPHQLLCLCGGCWCGDSSRQMSVPTSIRPGPLQLPCILNTHPRLFHLGKTVGGEAKPTIIMFKLCSRPFSVRALLLTFLYPAHLFRIAFVSQTLWFFSWIHVFPSLTWLSWHSTHNF